MFNNFFPEIRTVYEIMSKNVVETEGPQMTSQYGAYALRAGLARLHARMRMHAHTHAPWYPHARMYGQGRTHRPICISYCYSTATMVSWTRLIVTLYVHCQSCLYYNTVTPRLMCWWLTTSVFVSPSTRRLGVEKCSCLCLIYDFLNSLLCTCW
jgi:hypothetical protein